jgi:excisionase family DNA binding protein
MGEIRLLTIQETAEILRVHRSTISRLFSTGELPYVEVGSRKLVREEDLRGFIDSHIGNVTANESPKEK